MPSKVPFYQDFAFLLGPFPPFSESDSGRIFSFSVASCCGNCLFHECGVESLRILFHSEFLCLHLSKFKAKCKVSIGSGCSVPCLETSQDSRVTRALFVESRGWWFESTWQKLYLGFSKCSLVYVITHILPFIMGLFFWLAN